VRNIGRRPLAREAAQVPLDRGVRHLPHDQRQHQRGGDRAERRDQPPAEGAAGEPRECIETPGLEQRHQRDHGDRELRQRARQRMVAADPRLQAGITLGQCRRHAGGAVQRAEHREQRQPRQCENDGGDDGEAQQSGKAVSYIQRPDQPQRQQIEHGDDMPQPGEPVAQQRQRAVGFVAGADPTGAGGAVLQYDRRQEYADHQCHQLDQRIVGDAIKAEQQPDLGQRVAEDGDGRDAAHP
jgi:hypothetical protein